jgi:hypothetical protein
LKVIRGNQFCGLFCGLRPRGRKPVSELSSPIDLSAQESDAMVELAKLYRDSGDLAKADARATQGVAASQRVGDRYYVPRNLTILADLKARRGRIAEAKALYQHAEDVIDLARSEARITRITCRRCFMPAASAFCS